MHLSRASGDRLGKILSTLARRGLKPADVPARRLKRRLPVFNVPANAPVIPASRISPARSPQGAAGLLSSLVTDSLHVYLDSLPPPASENWCDAFAPLPGHRQVTDAYLLRLASAGDAALVTFDR